MAVPLNSHGTNTFYVRNKNDDKGDTFCQRPRRYRRAYDRAVETTRRFTLFEEDIRCLSIYSSMGHKSIQQASFNKSAANQCRLIKLRREATISLPDLFIAYNTDLNSLDGLDPALFRNGNKSSTQAQPPDDSSTAPTLTPRKQKRSPSSPEKVNLL
uniref:Uncharacterized protein n=1 Tax=Panagrellus redivivus TaxID=6233 RepID=A0A7E4W4Z8_PANRE